jgi:hypothetical protein
MSFSRNSCVTFFSKTWSYFETNLNFIVALVGGAASNEGYLYATNPATRIYGPVCDDFFTLTSVRKFKEYFLKLVVFHKNSKNSQVPVKIPLNFRNTYAVGDLMCF